jgi:hypothetical protein
MELASMLAGEPFSDHPVSVCPVIGSFMRAYNDSVDDERRQDLYAYASEIVGSRANAEVERARIELLTSWSWPVAPRRFARLRGVGRRVFGLRPPGSPEITGARVVHAISRHTAETHAAALRLIDALLAAGRPPERLPAPRLRQGTGSRPAGTASAS